MSQPRCRNASDPVMIVDDNEIDLELVKRFYQHSELQNPLIQFSDSTEALAHLGKCKASEEPVPSIVLLDINMPRINGFEILEKVRSDLYDENELPIIILSDSDNPRDEKMAEELKANHFCNKPHSLDGYVSFLNALAPL